MRVLLGAQLGHFALGQLGTARKVAATFAQRVMDGNKGLLAVSSANATVKRLDEVIEAVRCLARFASSVADEIFVAWVEFLRHQRHLRTVSERILIRATHLQSAQAFDSWRQYSARRVYLREMQSDVVKRWRQVANGKTTIEASGLREKMAKFFREAV